MSSRYRRRAARHASAELRPSHPRFFDALTADATVSAAYRSERWEFRGRGDTLAQALRLMGRSDAFLAQTFYRAKARLQALGVPFLPRVAHRLAIMTAQICIGDSVVVHPGVYFPHGQVAIDGCVEVHSGAVINPWVTIGSGPCDAGTTTIGPNANIGTGAIVIGPVTVASGAQVGANALVLTDVAAGRTVVGTPAVPLARRTEPPGSRAT
jgi:serine O-acetyltransferase